MRNKKQVLGFTCLGIVLVVGVAYATSPGLFSGITVDPGGMGSAAANNEIAFENAGTVTFRDTGAITTDGDLNIDAGDDIQVNAADTANINSANYASLATLNVEGLSGFAAGALAEGETNDGSVFDEPLEASRATVLTSTGNAMLATVNLDDSPPEGELGWETDAAVICEEDGDILVRAADDTEIIGLDTVNINSLNYASIATLDDANLNGFAAGALAEGETNEFDSFDATLEASRATVLATSGNAMLATALLDLTPAEGEKSFETNAAVICTGDGDVIIQLGPAI